MILATTPQIEIFSQAEEAATKETVQQPSPYHPPTPTTSLQRLLQGACATIISRKPSPAPGWDKFLQKTNKKAAVHALLFSCKTITPPPNVILFSCNADTNLGTPFQLSPAPSRPSPYLSEPHLSRCSLEFNVRFHIHTMQISGGGPSPLLYSSVTWLPPLPQDLPATTYLHTHCFPAVT